ncbi:MAG: hypothetical protein HYV14_02060 [Elusimicrobia bacterium]|nr:hypothetical protein [Elusimicrobiota bacterium]
MTTGSRTEARTTGPVAAICRDCREAAGAAAELRRAGVDLRRIAIVANELPTAEAAAAIADWRALAPVWVTVGCLNAIGAGLESLGLSKALIVRCRRALSDGGIIVLVLGAAEERT